MLYHFYSVYCNHNVVLASLCIRTCWFRWLFGVLFRLYDLLVWLQVKVEPELSALQQTGEGEFFVNHHCATLALNGV